MKKTTLKLAHDTLWEINRLVSDLSRGEEKKVTQDHVIRVLLEKYKKTPQKACIKKTEVSGKLKETKK